MFNKNISKLITEKYLIFSYAKIGKQITSGISHFLTTYIDIFVTIIEVVILTMNINQ